jgi:hypothetical protein
MNSVACRDELKPQKVEGHVGRIDLNRICPRSFVRSNDQCQSQS